MNGIIKTTIKRIALPIKKMSITRRLILYFSLLLTIQMLMIGWFSYSWVSSYLKERYIKKMCEINDIIMQQANYMRNSYEEQSDRILSNLTVQDLLLKNYHSSVGPQIYEDQNVISEILSDPTDTLYTIIVQPNGIIYQSYSGKYVSITYSQFINTNIYAKSLMSYGNNIWIPANENIMKNETEPFLYLCRMLKSLEANPRILGQLIMQIPIDILGSTFRQIKTEEGEYYAIVDNDGNYIYHTGDLSLVGKKADKTVLSVLEDTPNGYRIIQDGKNELILSYSTYRNKGWDIIHALPMHVISSSAETVRNWILLIMLLSIIVSSPLLILLSRKISIPIRKLKSAVERFGTGDLTTRTETNRMDEIGHLQSSFNTMADDINSLLGRINEENKLRRMMELRVLEYQINPHFLYNTLETINWMAHGAGVEDIEELATALARFFRVGLSKGREYYRIKDELEHVHQYLLINKIRYKECFQFEILSESNVLEYSTIKIILQPIVENSIKYGINKKGTDGLIRISVKKENDSVLFEVKDNGPGINKEKFLAIQNILNKHIQADMDSENGFGLYNVNKRIWMHYGNGYGIILDSNEGTGTNVLIRIPIIDPSGSF